MKYLLLIFLSLIYYSCDQSNTIETNALNKFSDPIIQRIYTLQDQRDTDSLTQYLTHEIPEYRKEAALAFGSVQDTTVISDLEDLLKDEFTEVKIAAAYAIGQTGSRASENKLINALYNESIPLVRKELLKALGKCATREGLQFLINQQPQDSLEKSGLAWAIYRAGLNGIHSEEGIARAVTLLDFRNNYETRLGATHFLYRTKEIDISTFWKLIAESAKNDVAPAVRMTSVRVLGKINSEEIAGILSKILLEDTDYRVRVNAIYAMADQQFELVQDAIFNALDDDNINTSIAAALYISNSSNGDLSKIFEIAKQNKNWRVKSILLTAAMKHRDNRSKIFDYIKNTYDASENNYEKAQLLNSLGDYPQSYTFIVQNTFQEIPFVIKTIGIQALAAIRTSQDFPANLENEFADIFKRIIKTNDPAFIGIVSQVISNPELNFKKFYQDIDFLYEAKSSLKLPKDIEALQILERTIAYFEEKEFDPVVNEYNHPIDWELVQKIAIKQKILIKTAKGDITCELLLEESPGTVANFYALIEKGYYNGKVFHRVVPNFVIQGGCPRGDGWGSENYSIRSELGPLRYYNEGYVGMASSGKDTEGVQWFITHSPTPHLDGRYSIFAKVIYGMEVVHKIEIGDQIHSIEIL